MKKRNFIGRSTRDGKQRNSSVYHSIHISGAKHYRIRRDGQMYIFSGISADKLKDIPDARVVGRFSKSSANGGGKLFELSKQRQGQTSKVDFDVYDTKRRFMRTVCYVPVGNHEFLAYDESLIRFVAIPGGAVAAAAVVAAVALAMSGGRPVNPLGIATGVTIGGEVGQEDTGNEMIDFAGYDSVTVSASNPYVYLQNPETNDVYFSYVISDSSGKEYITTDLIPPGRALQWDAKSALGAGSHTVNMHVDTFDMSDTAIPYNAMNYDSVKVTVQ